MGRLRPTVVCQHVPLTGAPVTLNLTHDLGQRSLEDGNSHQAVPVICDYRHHKLLKIMTTNYDYVLMIMIKL